MVAKKIVEKRLSMRILSILSHFIWCCATLGRLFERGGLVGPISEPDRDMFLNSFCQSAGGAASVSATAITGGFVDDATSLARLSRVIRGALGDVITAPNGFVGNVRKSVGKGIFGQDCHLGREAQWRLSSFQDRKVWGVRLTMLFNQR